MSLPNTSNEWSPSSFSVNPGSVGSPTESANSKGFVDRRNTADATSRPAERRQFGSSHAGLSDDGRELALAIDEYKVRHHRRYLTCDEMLTVLANLGYAKQPATT